MVELALLIIRRLGNLTQFKVGLGCFVLLVILLAVGGVYKGIFFNGDVRYWQTPSMGSVTYIYARHQDEELLEEALNACALELDRLEGVFSLYDESSSISILNRDKQLPNPPHELVELLSYSLYLYKATGGLFDVTLQNVWKSLASGDFESAKKLLGKHTGGDKIEVGYDLIAINDSQTSISLNAIAQGYITDKLVEILKGYGIKHALVNAGEFRALGKQGWLKPWMVNVEYSKGKRSDISIELAGEGLATSSASGTSLGYLGKFHIIDPRTGLTPNNYASVSVVAPSAALADALATSLTLVTLEEGQRMLEKFPSVKAYWWNEKGVMIR